MIRPALLLALCLAHAPLAGQAIDFGPRFVQFGTLEDGPTHRVRIGQNHGNALALALRAEHGTWRATVWATQTQAVTDTSSGPNPSPSARYDDVGLLALTLGPAMRAGPATLGANVGGLAMTCSFRDCGSSPLFGWLIGVDADVCSSGLRVCLRFGLEAVPPRRGRWTWLSRDRAGYDQSVPHDDAGGWMMISHLGLSVGLAL